MDIQSPLTITDLETAWERVYENEGCGGADGITVRAFGERAPARLRVLLERIRSGSYLPYPLLQIVIEKQPGTGKTRTLLVPAVADRIVQTAVARELSRSFEEQFLECSYAYRPGRGVDRAIARIRELHLQGYEHAVDADIESFFDEVDHDLLLQRLNAERVPPTHFELLRLWIRGEYWDGQRLHPLRKGIPQGSPVSPILANFFLEELDIDLAKADGKLIRYADDLLVLTRSPAEADEALRRIAAMLERLHLSLKLEKTRVATFAEGFHFLGVYFRGDDIWSPWKNHPKEGKVLFMAHPMPAPLRRRYEHPAEATAIAAAFRRAWDAPPPQAEQSGRSDMAFLYLIQQGSVLRKSGDRLLVEKDGQILLDTPYHKLDHVLVFGNVQVTTQALGELLEKGIAVSLFSRQGTLRGTVNPPRGKNVALRLKHFQASQDGARALRLASALVRGKLANGGAVLERYARREPGSAVVAFQVEIAAAGKAGSIAELDGIEGAAARRYFDAVMGFNRSALVWEGRKKHPATDGMNALLSLAYTLLMQEMAALLEGLGLDPCIGFLHQLDYGRPSLALDLIEPYRHPIADRFVLQLVNRKVVGPEQFVSRAGGAGLYLTPEALIRFFECYEKWMLATPVAGICFRQRLHHGAEDMARAIRDGGDLTVYAFDHETEDECFTSSVTI